ncbi:hypothetical protein EG329_002212 [Mollisiaceae sp. DMI_Dod_QoI]|nr:hypothetical protein EG329_002212 [Helotiales sp. DMI_Dod_QoI]
MATNSPPSTSTLPSVREAYNSRAATYDTATTFHSRLANAYVSYATPQPGESLLDLACGTGLVTFALAPHLQLQLPILATKSPASETPNPTKPKIIGIDLSPSMLSIARSKLSLSSTTGTGVEISFLEGDILHLDSIPLLKMALEDEEGEREKEKEKERQFDIITLSSALVLLPSPHPDPNPINALRHWIPYLKTNGRIILDIPHPNAMLGLKILSRVSKTLKLNLTLGDREWITGLESLRMLLVEAGLEARVWETGEWGDVPSRTVWVGRSGRVGVWGVDEGGSVFDGLVGGKRGWEGLGEEGRREARREFVREWELLGRGDGDGWVREENKLFIGVGIKR